MGPKIDSLFTFIPSSPSSTIANKIRVCKICVNAFELTWKVYRQFMTVQKLINNSKRKHKRNKMNEWYAQAEACKLLAQVISSLSSYWLATNWPPSVTACKLNAVNWLTTNVYLTGHSAIKALVLAFISDQRAGRFEPVTVKKKNVCYYVVLPPRLSRGHENLRLIEVQNSS